MLKLLKNQKGMTLLELLLVILMLNILLGCIYAIYSIALASWEVGVVRCEIIPQSRIALEKMSRELTSAKEGSIEVLFPLLPSPYLQFSTLEDKTYRYYFYDDKLLEANISEGDDPEKGEGTILISGITTPTLFTFDGNMITIILIAVKDKELISLETKIQPRN